MEKHSIEYLRECFHVCTETGEIAWKERPRVHFPSEGGWRVSNGRNANKTAGSIDSVGNKARQTRYKSVGVNGKVYKYHHIIWFFHYGYWPKMLDHINGNGLDNRVLNLREVDANESAKNLPLSATNTTGVMGVSWHKEDKRYVVSISSKYVGSFKTIEEATIARKEAEIQHGYHENHGKKKELRC